LRRSLGVNALVKVLGMNVRTFQRRKKASPDAG
jgi:uncharacterized protein (DUF2384 family)